MAGRLVESHPPGDPFLQIVADMATGRPAKKFTPEQVDRAKHLLGRRQYPSHVARDLREAFPGLTTPMSYRLIGQAQQEVFESLRGDGSGVNDPLTSTYLFLQSVVAGEKERTQDRIAASSAIIKLLGLNRLLDQLGTGDVDEFLAGVLARRKAREEAAAPVEGDS